MESDAPIPRLSLLNVMIVVFAGAIKLLYGHIYNTAMWSLPDRARGSFLSRLLGIYNVTISSGTVAQGAVTFTGTNGTTVPIGTSLVQIDGTGYVTVTAGTIVDGVSENIIVQSVELGQAQNYNGSELTLPVPPAGVDGTATVTTPITGGSDADTEEDSRNKLLARISTPITAGLVTDYERLALAVDGVGRVWVRGGDWWTGPNTVGLTLATRENQPVSAQALLDVQSTVYDDTNQQTGIVIGVYNLEEEPVTTHVKIEPDTQVLRDNVETTLTTLFRDGIAPSEKLKISDVRSAIKTAGVTNYEIDKLVIDSVEYEPTDIEPSPLSNKKYSYGGVSFV